MNIMDVARSLGLVDSNGTVAGTIDQQKVLGVFSDGDVLAAILSGVDLHTPLRNLVTGQFLSLKQRDLKHAFDLFREKGITLLPVVDDDYILQDVVTLHDVLECLEFRGEA